MVRVESPAGSAEVNADSVSESKKVEITEPLKQDNVSYETYSRILNEIKNTKEKLKEYEAREAEKANEIKRQKEESYQKQGEFKKLLEIREQEMSDLKKRFEQTENEKRQLGQRIIDDLKERAILSNLPGRLKKEEYINFVDKDKIAINPETGEIDINSVKKVANDFVESYSELLDTKTFGHLPATAPNGVGGKLTLEQWKSLPLNEMKKRLKDVIK